MTKHDGRRAARPLAAGVMGHPRRDHSGQIGAVVGAQISPDFVKAGGPVGPKVAIVIRQSHGVLVAGRA
jgi:hypothetical protein